MTLAKHLFGDDLNALTLLVGVWLGALGASVCYVFRAHTR